MAFIRKAPYTVRVKMLLLRFEKKYKFALQKVCNGLMALLYQTSSTLLSWIWIFLFERIPWKIPFRVHGGITLLHSLFHWSFILYSLPALFYPNWLVWPLSCKCLMPFIQFLFTDLWLQVITSKGFLAQPSVERNDHFHPHYQVRNILSCLHSDTCSLCMDTSLLPCVHRY